MITLVMTCHDDTRADCNKYLIIAINNGIILEWPNMMTLLMTHRDDTRDDSLNDDNRNDTRNDSHNDSHNDTRNETINDTHTSN